MFFESKQYVHGRRGLLNQIFQGLSLEKFVKKRFPEIIDQMIDYNFKSLITSFDKDQGSGNFLIKPTKPDFNMLGELIRNLIERNYLDNSC
jgi:hypothetical protein